MVRSETVVKAVGAIMLVAGVILLVFSAAQFAAALFSARFIRFIVHVGLSYFAFIFGLVLSLAGFLIWQAE